MPNYRGALAKILWGAGFANTLALGDGLDSTNAYSLARDGSDAIQYRSGLEDAWDGGDDQYFAAVARYIPRDDGATPRGNAVSGWNGATGWNAFLAWARRKNVLHFYPDLVNAPTVIVPCYLVAPITDPPEQEDNFMRRVKLSLRSSDGSVFDGY